MDLLPRPLSPSGVVTATPASFRWTWPGPREVEFDVVLLDEQFDEIYRKSVRGTECPVEGDLSDRLTVAAAGGQLHWCVVAKCRGVERRSAPVAFGFSR